MITAKTYAPTKQEMLEFLNSEISRYSKKIGSREKLSLHLGHAENYVRLVVKRQSFSALERLWKKCRKMC